MLHPTLYTKFLGFLIKDGKKKKAKAILDKALLIVSKKTGYSLIFILLKVFLNLNTFVEARHIRIKRRTHIVPFPISFKRRSYLILKWLIIGVKANKKKMAFSLKLAKEIFLIFKKSTTSQALKLQKINNKKANSNRSNIHFRW